MLQFSTLVPCVCVCLFSHLYAMPYAKFFHFFRHIYWVNLSNDNGIAQEINAKEAPFRKYLL